jgi:propanol-preferring alcohol dehydrogenase
MVLPGRGEPLEPAELPDPEAGPGQLRLQVRACGICRTDLHIVDDDLTPRTFPLVPGHQIVGVVDEVGPDVEGFSVGDRVGVPWLGWTCGTCPACRSGRENLCPDARFTGFDIPGGFATRTVADARYCFPIPAGYPDLQAAPLLCAGLIGYRCLRMAGEAERVGIYGFGGAAHILTQVARSQGRRIFAFTREGDTDTQAFATGLGAEWAGASTEPPPEPLDAAIVFAAAGELVPRALEAIVPGGTVVCGEIHMSDIPSFPYRLLWGERVLRSVANLTRRDGTEFLAIASEVPIRTTVTAFALDRTKDALDALRSGAVEGAIALSLQGERETRTITRGARTSFRAPGGTRQ